MPGLRDKNLRSGDLHEELGIFLLKMVALVAPVPRQEDLGNDAFATLIRPDGGRRLIPDLSFLVQLKSASVVSIRYTTVDEIAWIRSLDYPLFIGRTDLKQAKIELFTTQRLHQILLEQSYDEIELLLDEGDEASPKSNVRRANLGQPVHAWTIGEVTNPEFMSKSYAILRPHIDSLRRNLMLRGIQSQSLLRWKTCEPPTAGGEMTLVSAQSDIAATLREMAPHVRRLLTEIKHREKYSDLPIILQLIDLMRRWGADPDPGGILSLVAGCMAGGPDIPIEEAIRIRHAFQPLQLLDLRGLAVSDETLHVIPETVTGLALVDAPVTDAGVQHLLKLIRLKRLNISGTQVTDAGLTALGALINLEWVCAKRTRVTSQGVARLKTTRSDVEVVIESEP